MRDLSGLPHARMRAAIFWVLFLSWPAMRVTRHVWHPQWLGTVEDIGAIVTATAWLYGKLLFQDAQKLICRRLDEVERCWQLLSQQKRSGLEVIRGGGQPRPRHPRRG